jgi:ABC-type nitrate/sulfonate/bicarbonate transport system substrate-binding protein
MKGVPMARRKLVLLLAAVAATVLSVTSATAQAATAKFKHPDLHGQTMKVITTEGALDTVVLYHAEDLLRSWGATVNHIEAESTSSVVAGLASGSADVGVFSPIAGLNAIAAGLNIQAFGINEPRTDDVFVSGPSITSMSQVKGQVVGVNQITDISGLEAGLALGSAKLKIADVKIVQSGGQSVRTAAFLAGRLSAGPISFDNYKTALAPAGFHLLYNYMTNAPGLVHDVMWAPPAWISDHHQLAVAFNEAVLLSYRWFDNPKNRSAFITLATSKLNGETTASAGATYDTYLKYNFYPANEVLTLATLKAVESRGETYGILKSDVPPSQWIAAAPAKQALKAVGKVNTKKKK